MALKNKTRYAILGVLTIMNGSGYDIKKFCDKTISHFWNENFGHIYPVLNQLQAEGLIQQIGSNNEERRKVYGITEDGMRVFCDWLIQPVERQPVRSELMLKLSFGSHISKEKVIRMIEDVKLRHSSRLAEYRELESSYVNDEKARAHHQYPYWLAPLRYGILASEAAVRWCDETIENIKNHRVEG